MRFYKIIFILFLIGCNERTEINNPDIKNQSWLFEKQFIKSINDSSWERFSITPLNDYQDFKLDFVFISTGKPQSCGLYSKGVMVNKHNKNEKYSILFRPNLASKSTVLITKDSQNLESIKIEISNMIEFIAVCGDAHQYVVGNYDIVK